MFQKYKTPIIAIVIIVVLFVVYVVFVKGEEEPVLSSSLPDQSGFNTENNDLIALLATLESINLNRSILINEIFLSLYDFSVILIEEPVSRPNPFAPIGSDGFVPTVVNEDLVDLQEAGL